MSESFEEVELPPRQKSWVILISFGILYLTLDLVRRRKVKEDDSWLWLSVGFIIFILGTQFRVLAKITKFLGIVQPVSTIFFFGQMFLMLLGMQFSIKNSRIHYQIKNLIQEIALIRNELGQLKKKQ